MNTPVVTDVFKFLAVRPAQLVAEKETTRTIIRDKRAMSAVEKRELTALAGQLSTSGVALAHWRELDISLIEPLAEGYRELTRSYERLRPGENPPEAKTLMKDAGLSNVKDGNDPDLISAAWKALYAAHATGRDAGPRLEVPMAALRVLHFAQTLAGEPRPSPFVALEALRATVAIPILFDAAFQPPSSSPAQTASVPNALVGHSTTSPDALRRSEQILALATDLNATERLFESVTNAPPLANSAARQVSLGPTAGWSDRFNLSTTPLLSDALPAQLSRTEAAVLDQLRLAETTPAHIAAQALQSHLQKLTDRASVLVDDPEFQTAMREITRAMPLQVAPILPPIIIAGLGTPDASGADVDVSGRITPLGFGDLKVVKQTLLAYVAGEVAHIENVLKGESKERTHRKLDRTETTIFTSEETTKDTERDTQSTDRFELKREAETTLKEDMSIKAGLTVTGAYGPVVATATGDFAYSTSKQDSAKSSSNFAREVVDRAVTKVQTKTKAERTTKTLNEVEEINRHSLNNEPPSAAHVTGIYRWVDKRYRAQVYNYGVRLLLEFVIPEPAAFYRATHESTPPKVNGKPPYPFVTDGLDGFGRSGKPLTAKEITEFNYPRYAAKYGAAGVLAPPPLFTYIGLALAPTEGVGLGTAFSIASKDFLVPGGYKLNSYSVAVSCIVANFPRLIVQVRGDIWTIVDLNNPGPNFIQTKQIGDPAADNAKISSGAVAVSVPVSVVGYDIAKFALNIQGVGVRTDEAMTTWRNETFGKIQTAYQALQTAYDQKVTQAEAAAGITIEGQNPAINRIVEKNELKKLCITMLTGQHFNKFGKKPGAMTEPPDDAAHPPEVDVYEALYQGPIIQFFEQAFEWEQLTYVYYPYFWGRKKNWGKVAYLSDPDPLFQQFLTAGAARVLVPVPLAYAQSVIYLLQNGKGDLRDRVWGGGETVTINSPLYISIAEGLRNQTDDLAGAEPDPDVQPWEFTLPTTLVWLQPDATLPTFP